MQSAESASSGFAAASTAKVIPGRSDAITLCRIFCLLVGPFLFLDGLAGLLFASTGLETGDRLPREEWNWVFQFNGWHQLLHVLNGAVLTAGAIRGSWAPTAALAFGASYAVMAPVGFLDGDDIFNLFYSAVRENLVHSMFAVQGVTIGLLGLFAACRARTAHIANPRSGRA